MDEPRKNAEHANKGYEESEVNAGRLIAFAAGVIGLVVVGVVGSLVVFKFFVSHESLGPPASPFENVRSLPPEPRLQTRAPLDLDHYRAQQQKILDSYGWVDPPAGIVRIPVNRAMDLLLQKGYPVRGSVPVNGQPNTPGETAPPPNRQTAPTPVFGEGGGTAKMIASACKPKRAKSDSRTASLSGLGVTALLMSLLFCLAPRATGQVSSGVTPPQLRGVGIDQRLNNQVPLDLKFRDESGQTVMLGSYFGKKPVILSLVYYSCPMLCTMSENALLNALRDVQFNIGQQFQVLTVSIDPTETPEMATGKKSVYVGLYGRPGAKQGWHFLVGEEPSIRALAQAVGFHYNYIPETKQFAHATGLVVLTPQGKVSRYFYGITYPPRDLRLALVEASNEKIGSPVDAILLYCCEYNPATGRYSVLVSRILQFSGVITLLCIGTLVFALSRGGRQNSIQDSKFKIQD